MMNITLLPPDEDDATWRIVMQDQHLKRLPMTTRMKLDTPTLDIVKLLHSMHRGATITGPAGERMHPRPPGGLPRLHHSQPQPRR